MRLIYILAVAMLMCSCAENKNDDGMGDEDATENVAKSVTVPEAATAAFTTAYPNATDVEWEQEDDMYEVGFKVNGLSVSILYKPDGSVYATETGIPVAQLPEAVSKAAKTMGEITEACKIEMADGSIQYEAEVGGKDYIYDVNGGLIREEADEADDDDDDHGH